MTTNRTAERPRLVFCRCVHYEIIPPASKERILAALSQAGISVEVVDDLCGLAAHRDPRLQDWVAAPSLAIVACFPRAIRWLFHAAGAPLSDGQVRLFNMRTQSPEDILGALLIEKKSVSSASPNHQSSIINQESSWVPWFPVIDYDRCANCKQCLNFCLFGVYQLSEEGQVLVRNPAGCKTNCPACARMCPQKAIIFPKYGESPINGEEVPVEADPGAGPDEGQLGGDAPAGDLYDRIRRRSAGQKRFSTVAQDPSLNRSCPTLEGLRRELGIPESVLNSLSPAELQRIAAQKSQGPSPRDSRPDAGGKDKEDNG